MLHMIEEEIGEMKLKLHRETSIPIKKSNRDGNKKYKEIYDLIDEFVSSDMNIASVDIPAHFDKRRKMLFEQAVRYVARVYDVKANKRDDKIYLSKNNKED